MNSKTNISYKVNDSETITGFWNGKIYAGYIYINPEVCGEIFWRKSRKLIYDQTKITSIKKSIPSNLPTNVADWMRLMEKSETV